MTGRVNELCDRYVDSDIGFVDAAVLAMVERLGEEKLATIDHRHADADQDFIEAISELSTSEMRRGHLSCLKQSPRRQI